MAVYQWILAHWQEVVTLYLALVGAANIYIKLTPTLKDDNILLAITKFIGKWIALNKYGPSGEARPN